MVSRGAAVRVRLVGLHAPDEVAPVALARAQAAGIGFRVDRLGRPRPDVRTGRDSHSPDVTHERVRGTARPPRMVAVPRIEPSRVPAIPAVAVPSLAGATLAVAVLQDRLGVPNPSALYLLAVVATAVVCGDDAPPRSRRSPRSCSTTSTSSSRATRSRSRTSASCSICSCCCSQGSWSASSPARQRARAEDAIAREREARALFGVSRELATRESTPSVLPTIADILPDRGGDGPFDRQRRLQEAIDDAVDLGAEVVTGRGRRRRQRN